MNPKRLLNTRLIILGGIVFVLIGGWLMIRDIHNSHVYTANLTIEVAPADATLNLDGKKTKAGKHAVAPGKHTVTAARKGFASQTKTATSVKADKGYLGFVLNSDSKDTANWYLEYPKDAKLAEGISSKSFDQSAAQREADFPLTKDLPFIDNLYRIDYGVSKAHPENPKATAIYITLYAQSAKQDALDWLSFKGYDPNKLEIIYR